ncbi:MAG TPA: aspartate/glutamate racemase family protein [Amaricoccus sp.]|uniref:maleate cis-trans isomerase family protein n=1 Tax=Amaricoccus sp. TaxID=1872485 RepID=UPI002B5D7407|nr:aspartate/glutamate racemase family protein [Amaricoccus sp.]HMQ93813.1 aspartate/glutamate racemase family protein [Amaricoccus sp.]HMR53802.1 aspartate/glutamate racemase family protein [Amaricoccus sp.]HMU01356.1 aspartate/glutamate racemase family protein [Amaricoccus sp.]
MPDDRTLIGVLTPSSNTVLEPLTSAMIADLPDVSAHFGRFSVTEISMNEGSQSQFELENPLAAARLLADARVDAIVWSGTSASWLGFERDRDLCARIAAETGIPAGSSVLAINDLFAAAGVKTFGLVSPYVEDVQERIVANYARNGLQCVAERHLNETVNYAFAEFDEATIAAQIRAVAETGPDAITVMCTNMRGARIVPELEAELGIPIFDSTAAAVWTGMKLAGDDPARIRSWGRLFAM